MRKSTETKFTSVSEGTRKWTRKWTRKSFSPHSGKNKIELMGWELKCDCMIHLVDLLCNSRSSMRRVPECVAWTRKSFSPRPRAHGARAVRPANRREAVVALVFAATRPRAVLLAVAASPSPVWPAGTWDSGINSTGSSVSLERRLRLQLPPFLNVGPWLQLILAVRL